MKLKGSCHCGLVKFKLESSNYYPYQCCYCSICRKTQGGGGFAINISGKSETMKVKGEDFLRIYQAKIKNPEDKKSYVSFGERYFCKNCGSALWLFDPNWPDLIHPFASAIDTPLPVPPVRTHIMLEFKSPWVEVKSSSRDKEFQRYPKESIAEWHDKNITKDEEESFETAQHNVFLDEQDQSMFQRHV